MSAQREYVIKAHGNQQITLGDLRRAIRDDLGAASWPDSTQVFPNANLSGRAVITFRAAPDVTVADVAEHIMLGVEPAETRKP